MPLHRLIALGILPVVFACSAGRLVVGSNQAGAADPFAAIAIEGAAEIQDDWTFAADNTNLRANDLTLSIEPETTLRLAPRLAVVTELVLESLSEVAAGNDRKLGDLGLSVETMFLAYNADRLGGYIGKINPPFGIAWSRAPGLYGTDFAEDYEITERLGAGGYVDLGRDESRAYRISASTFFRDTSPLSESAFNNRGRFEKRRGGPSNTETLSSFTVALDGPVTRDGLDLNLHAAAAYQRGGEGDPEDEIGGALAAYGSLPMATNSNLELLFEAVYQGGAAAKNQDRLYLTAGAAIVRGPWILASAYSRRATDQHGASTPGSGRTDHLAQLSLAYEFEYGVTIEAGYRYSEEGNSDQHVVGLLLSYELDFAWR